MQFPARTLGSGPSGTNRIGSAGRVNHSPIAFAMISRATLCGTSL